MTQDEVRALAGKPRSTWVPDIAGMAPKPGVVEEAWGYPYRWSNEIALYFEDAKLIRWKVSGSSSSGTGWNDDPFGQPTWGSIDTAHHAKGHKHHHGHK